MYGLPKSFDPTRLIGHTLEQIRFGIAQIQFAFDQSLLIAVTSALSYQEPSFEEPRLIEFPVLQSNLMQLLHHSIVDAFGDNEGALTLKFDNGHILRCFDDQPGYEAYTIKLGDEEIIV